MSGQHIGKKKMDKEDKQIIDRAVKEEWRIGDRSRLKRLLEKNLKLYRENEILEGCLIAEQEHTQMLEQQIEKMKCCGNCRFDYCERSSECIDKDGNRTFHCWNEEKERYCDVGKEGKYQCWEIKEYE